MRWYFLDLDLLQVVLVALLAFLLDQIEQCVAHLVASEDFDEVLESDLNVMHRLVLLSVWIQRLQ